MKKKTNKIFESSLLQNSAKISVSNIIMYMLPLIVTSILARLYTPEAFGEWGIFSSFVTIANIGLFLGFENVIIQAKEEEVSNITKLCIIISMFILSHYRSFLYWHQGRDSLFYRFPSTAYPCSLSIALFHLYHII